MRVPVIIHICGSVSPVSGEQERIPGSESKKRTADPPEQIRQQCAGTLHMTEDMISVNYTQKDDAGLECRSLLKVLPGEVRLIRRGTPSSQMIFERGKTCTADYEVSGVIIPLQVLTRQMTGRGIFYPYFSEEEQKPFPDQRNILVLEYTLQSGGLPVSENRLELEIMPQSENRL